MKKGFAKDEISYGTAGLLRRIIAALLDGLILHLFGYLLSRVFLKSLDLTSSGMTVSVMTLVYLLSLILIYILYGTIFESSKFQATLGKKLIGIRVINDDNRNPNVTIFRALLRNILKFLSFIFALSFIVILFRGDRKALHDMFSGTHVVESGSIPIHKLTSSLFALIVLLLISIFLGNPTFTSGQKEKMQIKFDASKMKKFSDKIEFKFKEVTKESGDKTLKIPDKITPKESELIIAAKDNIKKDNGAVQGLIDAEDEEFFKLEKKKPKVAEKNKNSKKLKKKIIKIKESVSGSVNYANKSYKIKDFYIKSDREEETIKLYLYTRKLRKEEKDSYQEPILPILETNLMFNGNICNSKNLRRSSNRLIIRDLNIARGFSREFPNSESKYSIFCKGNSVKVNILDTPIKGKSYKWNFKLSGNLK